MPRDIHADSKIAPSCDVRSFLAFNHVVHAQDASACIQLQSVAKSQQATNTCSDRVAFMWCVRPDNPDSKGSWCGARNTYYPKLAVLKAGESWANPYGLPLEATIEFIACLGGYESYEKLDDYGRYIACKAQPELIGESKNFTTTASGPSQAQACLAAKTLAAKAESRDACGCVNRTGVFVCKFEYAGAGASPSWVEQAMKDTKALARNWQACDGGGPVCTKRSGTSNGTRD